MGDTTQILYTLLPYDRPLIMADAEFESSDETVAVADDYGIVKGLAPGETVIKMTVSTFLSDDPLVMTEIHVNVTESESVQVNPGSREDTDGENSDVDTGDNGAGKDNNVPGKDNDGSDKKPEDTGKEKTGPEKETAEKNLSQV